MTAISVVIPVYNAQKFLSKCLESILTQTLRDVEIICVDDGSTDESLAILDYYALRDSRIKILTQMNQNAGIARNAGLELAIGDYLFFMDADDILMDNTVLEKIYAIAQKTNSYIVKFKAKAFLDITGEYCPDKVYEGVRLEKNSWNRYLSLEFDIDEILKLCVAPWVGLYKREFLLKAGVRFNANKCCNDRSFNVISILEAGGVFLSDLTVVNHRKSSASLITIRDKYFECHFNSIRIIQKYLETTSCEPVIKRKVLIRELRDIYSFYQKFSKKSKYFYSIYRKIIKFAKSLDLESLLPDIQQEEFYYILISLKKSSSIWSFVTYYSKRFYNQFLYKLVTVLILANVLINNRSKKVVFWGASLWLGDLLSKFPWVKKHIIGIIDMNEEKQKLGFYGLKVFAPSELAELKPELIILSVENNSRLVYNNLRAFLSAKYPEFNLAFNIFGTEFIELCKKR